jgi:hypothetical protein
MAPPTPLPSFTGRVYLRGTSGYTAVCPQYASLNQTGDQSMQPFAIIRPAGDEDVKAAVTWARQNKVAVAVRTGVCVGGSSRGVTRVHTLCNQPTNTVCLPACACL